MKILKIDTTPNCVRCPYRVDFFDPKSKTKIDKDRCRRMDRIIKNVLEFPTWCPLSDYKEEILNEQT